MAGFKTNVMRILDQKKIVYTPHEYHSPDGTAPEQEGAPFFLYCGFFSPHMPLIPPEEVSGTVEPEKVPEVRIQPRADEDIAEVELYRRAFSNPPEVLIDPHVLDEQRKRDRVLQS